VKHLVVLRHGRTAWNAERRFQGQLDPPLDDVGYVQAYEVAGMVAALEPDLLVTSDAARCVQTAERIAAVCGLALLPDPRLRERSLGHWEGLTRGEVAAAYPDEYADWVDGRDVSRRGGETREQVAARALAVMSELPEYLSAVLVTHSATALSLCTALLELDQRMHVLAPLANCHWTQLQSDPHRGGPSWLLRAHNVGVPGGVVPTPRRPDEGDDASDAEA
jgi:glucosyl-3-phosphoglycerate phosphatase